MDVYLLCPECQKITEGTGAEIGIPTVDVIYCKVCEKKFKCAGGFSKGESFKSLFNKDKKFCVPFDIADSFHC